MSSSSVVVLISGWAAAALVIASLVWLPTGTRLIYVMQNRSQAVICVGFGVLGLAIGIVTSMILGSVATVSALPNGYSPGGDIGAFVLTYLPLAPMFVLPSVLGWPFASVKAKRSLATRPALAR